MKSNLSLTVAVTFFGFLKQSASINRRMKLLSITVGSQDFALAGSTNLAGVLEENGIAHEPRITDGGRTRIKWRHYLTDLAPRLFQ